MATFDLKGVHKVTIKGRTYYYAWRGKKAPRLTSKPGTIAFVKELAEALEAHREGDKTTFGALCRRYKASDDYLRLSDKTLANWRPWVDRIELEFGKLKVAQFDKPTMRPVIVQWRDRYKATPRAADVGRSVFSRILSFGISEGRLSTNIVAPIKQLHTTNRASIIWTDEDLAKLEAVAPKEIMWSVKLALRTGLRQGDLLRLRWSDVSEFAIELTPSKTRKVGTTVLIPMYPALKATIAEIPMIGPFVLTNQHGRPWKGGFGSSWNKAVTKAGVEKHFHDLRGTAATALYKSNLSVREIAAIMGWTEKSVEGIITKYVDRKSVLVDLGERLSGGPQGNTLGTESVKPSVKLGGES